MSLRLGIRIALAGGRDSRVRFGLMVLGTAVGTLLILLTLIVLPALQGRIDRYAWHRTDADTPATAPDPALWLPVTDRYEGRSVVRFQVAALGGAPPMPPGLERLPEPGEVFVSPALAELIATAPEAELAARFPGEVVGLIGEAGLVSPDELVAVIGRTSAQLREIPGTMVIRGVEAPGDRLDLDVFVMVLVGFIAILVVGPVALFVMMSTRIDAARRGLRFAALRLAGATRGQTWIVAVAETGGASVLGAGLGLLAFHALVPILQSRLHHEGLRFPTTDFQAPAWPVGVVVAAIPVIAVASSLVTLHRAQISPLGTHRRQERRPLSIRLLLPLALGFGLGCVLSVASFATGAPGPVVGVLSLIATLSQLIGMYLVGGYLCMVAARALTRFAVSAPALIAARRIAADPFATFRAVGGVTLAAFVATMLATGAGQERAQAESNSPVLDDGVVLVLTRGASEDALAPLLSRPGVVVAHQSSDAVTVPCADLARVTSLDCPLRRTDAVDSDLYDLFAGVPFVRDLQDEPLGPWLVVETSPRAAPGPIHSIFVPTDGTSAAIERVRSQAVLAAPYGLARTHDDWIDAQRARGSGGVARILQIAMLFVIVVAAASLTVSMIATMVERRRPYALLRAAGMPMGQLRRMSLFETTLPLVVTSIAGMAIAYATTTLPYLITPEAPPSSLPSASFFASVGVGLLAAAAVSLVSWPFMETITRHDSIRYE